MSCSPLIHHLYEPQTGSWQYVVADPVSRDAVIIDPVLNYDLFHNAILTEGADSVLSLVRAEGYNVVRLLETHIHGDHITGAKYLHAKLERLQGSKPGTYIGKRVIEAQERYASMYNIPKEEYISAFDGFLEDDEIFSIGQLSVKVLYLPGHTLEHVGYMIGENIFNGDSIWNADIGTARADFPGADASSVYASSRRLFSLPDHVKVFTAHDYPLADEGGRAEPMPFCTVSEQRQKNKHLHEGVDENTYVQWRNGRDASSPMPTLMHHNIQFNIRAGALPKPSPSGALLVHVPLTLDISEWSELPSTCTDEAGNIERQ